MTTEELLQIIADAKTRKEVAEAYSIAIEVDNRANVDFPQVNAAIKEKWGRPGLLYIKNAAWRLHDQRVVTNQQEGL